MSICPITSEGWVGIVDDDESIRRSLVRLLRVYGIRAQAFGTADEYLESAGSPPCCLLLDVQLGTSTGFELYERLAEQSSSVPPVIFISAYDDPATLQQARACGARGWLRKPFTVSALMELLEPLLPNRRAETFSIAARSTNSWSA